MSQFAMITEQGVNKINEANAFGEYIEIAYYVPAYDYRIDPNLGVTDSSISANNIFTVTNSADTVPQGEVIWNTTELDSYELTTNDDYLAYTGNETTATSGTGIGVTNFAHNAGVAINKFKTSAIGEYFTADTVVTPGNAGAAWFFSTAGYNITTPPTSSDGYGPSDISNPDSSSLFRGVTYQPVFTSAGDDSRANFKVTVRCPVGLFKFNKIGLYAVKRSADGTLVDNPFLFGQVIISQPQLLYSNESSSNSFALGELTLDFQIETQTVSADFENVFFSTSGDYWVRTSNESDGNYGLLYDGSVYVANRLAIDDKGNVLNTSADRGVSKLFVSTFEEINAPESDREKDIPQLCLQYVDKINENRIRTTFRTNTSGDCEVDLYGACSSASNEVFSVIPAIDKEYGLGIRTNRWDHLNLSNKFEMFNAPYSEVSASDSDEFYVSINATNRSMVMYNSELYLRPSESVSAGESTNWFNGNLINYDNRELVIKGSNGAYILSTNRMDYNGRFINNANILVEKVGNTIDVDANNWTSEQFPARQKDADTIAHYITNDDYVYIAGTKVYTYGDIVPMRNVTDSLGDTNHMWSAVYTDSLVGADYSDDNGRNIKVHSDLVPNDKGYSIKDNSDGARWSEINAIQIGRDDLWVNSGFFDNMFVKALQITNDGGIEFTDEDGDTTLELSKSGLLPIISNFKVGQVGGEVAEVHANHIFTKDFTLGGNFNVNPETDTTPVQVTTNNWDWANKVNNGTHRFTARTGFDSDGNWVRLDSDLRIYGATDDRDNSLGDNDKRNLRFGVQYNQDAGFTQFYNSPTKHEDGFQERTKTAEFYWDNMVSNAPHRTKIVAGVRYIKIYAFYVEGHAWDLNSNSDIWKCKANMKFNAASDGVEPSSAGEQVIIGSSDARLDNIWVKKINDVSVRGTEFENE